MKIHATHEDIVKRLKRAGGHLSSIIRMIEEEAPCLEVAQQMHAVSCAIENAKKEFIHDHMDHCLEEALNKKSANQKAHLHEFKNIAKFL